MEYPCTTPYDVFISGGGPAGALLAIHLQRFGLNVLLCGTPRRFDSLEGMTERGVLALQASHCKHALASLGPLVLRQARWSCEQFGGNREYLVQRSVFDTALWQDASLAGVDSLRGRVDRVVWQEACWQTKVGNRQIRARYWVDARGRQAPANAMLQQAPGILGIGAWWQGPATEPAAGITSFADGWCWYARLPDGRTQMQVFVDATTHRPPSRAQLRSYYLQLVSQCDEAATVVQDSQLSIEPFVRGSGLSYSEPMPGHFHARAGDAALALDPLAGHGMFEAMALSMTLASCVRTQLDRSSSAELAMSFYRGRVQDEFWRLARTGRDFYQLETQWSKQSFWSRRQHWPDAEPSHPCLEPGMGRIEMRPVSINGYIESRQVVTCPDTPRGTWLVGDVPLVELLEYIRQKGGVPARQNLEAFCAGSGWSMQSVGAAITWLAQRQLLDLKNE